MPAARTAKLTQIQGDEMQVAKGRPPFRKYVRSWYYWWIVALSALFGFAIFNGLINDIPVSTVCGIAIGIGELFVLLGCLPRPFVGRDLVRWFGGLLLAVSLSVVLVFLVPSGLLNVLHGDGPNINAAGYGAEAFVALIGTYQVVRHPNWVIYPHPSRSVLVIVALAVLLGSGLWSGHRLFHSKAPDGNPTGNFELVSFNNNGSFYDKVLKLEPGPQQIQFWNRDFSWHTFTIDSLGINLLLPYEADRLLHLNAPPGVYEFYCAIPGHRAAGEVGTLTVAEPTAAPPN